MNLKRSVMMGLLPIGMILAQDASAQALQAFGLATGALKNMTDIGSTANSGGQQTFVDDLSYKSFNVDLVPAAFDERRLGMWHDSKIVCRIRVRDPNLGTTVSNVNTWVQDTGRWWNNFFSPFTGAAVDNGKGKGPAIGQGDVGEPEGTYAENPEGLPPLHFAEYLYKINIRWGGRVLWDKDGNKTNEAMELLGQISMDQQMKSVAHNWDSRIAANSSGKVWNAGTSTKFISRVRMTVRLHWAATGMNWAGTDEFERAYDIFGSGRVDDQWVLENNNSNSVNNLAKKKGVFWKCSDPIETLSGDDKR